MKQQKGTIRKFIEEKFFGFIASDDSAADWFFHGSQLTFDAKVGDRVVFDVGENRNGPAAVNVRRAEDSR